jgi:hypothetical protein
MTLARLEVDGGLEIQASVEQRLTIGLNGSQRHLAYWQE